MAPADAEGDWCWVGDAPIVRLVYLRQWGVRRFAFSDGVLSCQFLGTPRSCEHRVRQYIELHAEEIADEIERCEAALSTLDAARYHGMEVVEASVRDDGTRTLAYRSQPFPMDELRVSLWHQWHAIRWVMSSGTCYA